MMTFTEDVIESYVVSLQSPCLSSSALHINRPSGISTQFPGRGLDATIAAGWANRLGTSLFRLKYGLDTAVYRNALLEYLSIAIEAGHSLGWPDDELTALLAEFVLLSWLTDRRLWSKGDVVERAEILRAMLNEEERQTASLMMAALR